MVKFRDGAKRRVCGFSLTEHAVSFFASRYGIKAVRNTHIAGSVLLDDLEKFEHISRTISANRFVCRFFRLVEPWICTEKFERRLGDQRSVIAWMPKSVRVWAETVARSRPKTSSRRVWTASRVARAAT